MKKYNVKCPTCGTVNKGLFLDETDGWMECECCHKSSQDKRFQRTQSVRVPLFTMEELALYAREVLG